MTLHHSSFIPEKLKTIMEIYHNHKYKMDTDEQTYIQGLTEEEHIALRIATQVFGKNFRLKETRGFIEWKLTHCPSHKSSASQDCSPSPP